MFQLGPLSIPYSRFFLLLAIIVLGLSADILARQQKDKLFSTWGWNAGFIALIAARVGFVFTHLDDFLPRPLTVFYIWQGGFDLLGGIVGGFAYTLWFFRKQLKRLSFIALPVLSVIGVWIIAQLFTPNTNTTQPLPTMTLYQLDETPLQLTSLIGKPLVINVWATWCLPCRREMPMLHSLATEHPEITFLFINQGEDSQSVQSYFNSIGVSPEHVLLDPRQEYSQFQGVVGYPSTYFYNAEGQQIEAAYGELSRAILNDHLEHIR